jgi:hypothetical protein
MAKNRDKDRERSDADRDKSREANRKRVIGEGMTSPDSTQVPLKAETGEPDYDAIRGRIPPEEDNDDDDRSSR